MPLDFYSIVAVFAVCCVCGYLVENVWCLLRLGRLESRKSLVYGPLSVCYGMGGLLLTVLLYKLQSAAPWKVFLLSFAAGTAVEYLCSWGQEFFFHSVAWDYSNLPLNINGRVCLYYSLFWGALGLVWARLVFPLMNAVAGRLRGGYPRWIAWAFTAFFIFDCFMSASAAARMLRRDDGEAPRNSFEVMLDDRFPDERIHAIYANSHSVVS